MQLIKPFSPIPWWMPPSFSIEKQRNEEVIKYSRKIFLAFIGTPDGTRNNV